MGQEASNHFRSFLASPINPCGLALARMGLCSRDKEVSSVKRRQNIAVRVIYCCMTDRPQTEWLQTFIAPESEMKWGSVRNSGLWFMRRHWAWFTGDWTVCFQDGALRWLAGGCWLPPGCSASADSGLDASPHGPLHVVCVLSHAVWVPWVSVPRNRAV